MLVNYSEIQIDPFPDDPDAVSFYVSKTQEGWIDISDSDRNALCSMPIEVLHEILKRLDDLDIMVDPADEVEDIPF
jgi:hypothetical protein